MTDDLIENDELEDEDAEPGDIEEEDPDDENFEEGLSSGFGEESEEDTM